MESRYKLTNKKILHLLFVLWLFTEIAFEYTAIAQACLLMFVVAVFLISRKIHFSYYCVLYFGLIVWSEINIMTGNAISSDLANTMTRTLIINLFFLMAFYEYCNYIGEVWEILALYRNTLIVFSIVCILLGATSALSGERLSIFGLNANGIAKVVAFASIIDLYEIIVETNKRHLENAIHLLLFFSVILLSGSRSGLLIPLIGLYILFCWKNPKKVLPYTLFIVIGFTLIIQLLLHIPFLYQIIGNRIESLLLLVRGLDYDEASLKTRSYLIQIGWNRSQDSLLLGHGLDCFRLLKGALNTYSHNNYIELLYSLGWVGVALYYFPYVVSIFKYPGAKKKDKYMALLMIAILIPNLIIDYSSVPYFVRRSLIMPLLASYGISKIGESKSVKNSEVNS